MVTQTKKEQVSFKLAPEMIRKLRAVAAEWRRPLTTQLEIILEEYFARNGKKAKP